MARFTVKGIFIIAEVSPLVYAIAFNTPSVIAWWTGILFIVLSVICIGFMFLLRGRDSFLQNRSQAITLKWQTTLNQVTVIPKNEFRSKGQDVHRLTPNEKKNLLETLHEQGRFDPIEPIPNQELPDFLFLWNYLHETVFGESKENLNSLANALEINQNAGRMLQSRSLKNQILAINTLGNLREETAYEQIERIMLGSDPIISLWAWRALFRIDFEKTLQKHLAKIALREDWSPAFVVKVLLELDSKLISQPLIKLVEESYQNRLIERQLSRIISYLSITHLDLSKSLIHKILTESEEVEVIIACLRLVNSRKSLPRVRELLKSERWEIRLQVVQTIGRFGVKKDEKLLISALNDLDWWVRYRAATALIQMPSMSEERFEKLSTTLPNEFARDILHQVLAEIRLLCYVQPSSSILSR